MNISDISTDLTLIVFGLVFLAFAINDPVQIYPKSRRGWLVIRRELKPKPKPIASFRLRRRFRVLLAIFGVVMLVRAAWDIILQLHD